MRMDIPLPHIAYTVKVRPIVKVPDDMVGCPAWCETDSDDDSGCTLYFGKSPAVTTIVHELVHVLQHICKIRFMSFTEEVEGMAYTMQYLLMKILGAEWEQPKKSKTPRNRK